MGRFLPSHESNHAVVVRPDGEIQGTVLYFPGCGSERMHVDIGLASIFLLLHSNMRVVLPPKYLCCGYPARANAKGDLGSRQELRNTIIFNQIRSMLGHIEFDRCIVSCGTCREALTRIRLSEIFEAPVTDIAEYALMRDFTMDLSGPVLYHQPCHDSLDGKGETLLRGIAAGHTVDSVPHCCSEAGTLALSRPDIAAAMFERKQALLSSRIHRPSEPPLLVTNCPACLNGLGRQRLGACQHMAVVMADGVAPMQWRAAVKERMGAGDIIRF